jgi:hypothetical protein
MKNKILLLFPDGVGIRNYLYTDVFEGLEKNVALFHAFDSKTIQAIQDITKIEEAISIPKYNESIKEKFFRELICLARLKHNAKLVQNPTLITNWKTNHSKLKNRIFYKAVAFYAKWITNYQQILILEKNYQRVLRENSFYNKIKTIFKETKPSQIFCSHQRGVQCAPIFAAAADMGIKTTTIIYSWDNLPKARLALKADQYLVWSDYMKEEMHLYYPEIDGNQVIITGTPQFECYEKPENRIPKEAFYAKYNLDTNKKIICFSGDDVKTSPDDPKYLDDLASELIKNGLSNEYQILLRRCPVDISGRFDATILKYGDLIKQAPPLWHYEPSSAWTTIYPLPEDVSLLVSTAFYSDLVVNVGSTMAFDFAMFNKPCLYINYDQKNQLNTKWSVRKIYQFQHFRSMPNADCVIWWNNKEEIAKHLNELTFQQNMNDWQTIVLSDFTNASTKINQVLK